MKKKSRALGRDRDARKRSLRKIVVGNDERPRLCVFRSLKFTYAQLISDETGRVFGAASTQSESGEGVSPKSKGSAHVLGKKIASIALEKGISKVVFDRNGYRYHGRISAVADGAREAGLEF
jgi:large subunit ribosomal protein L18